MEYRSDLPFPRPSESASRYVKRHSSTYSSKEDDEDLLEKLEKVTSQRDILVEMILNGDKYSVLRTWAALFNGGSHMPSSGGEGDRD